MASIFSSGVPVAGIIASEKPFKYLCVEKNREQQKDICDNPNRLKGRMVAAALVRADSIRRAFAHVRIGARNHPQRPALFPHSCPSEAPHHLKPSTQILPMLRRKRQGLSVIAFHLLGQPVPTELIDNTRATCLESPVKVPIIN